MNNPRQITAAAAARHTVLASLALLALLLSVFTPPAHGNAPAALYTYRSSNCSSVVDPLNVRWFNIDWLSVKVGLEQYMSPWGTLQELPPIPGLLESTSQYAYNAGACEKANYSTGRQWGPMIYLPLAIRKYKFHARLFTTGSSQVAADAHLERKRRVGTCDDTGIGWNDAVYRRYNGKSGFDAAMDKVMRAYKRYSSSDVRVVRSLSPFAALFKQCSGEIVQWSGRVAYITRPGP